jgi:hypothetical protein
MNYQPILARLPEEDPRIEPCYAFSVHKCGSSMLFGMLVAIGRQAKIPVVSLPDMLFNEGVFETDWLEDVSLRPAFGRRMLYCGFRVLPPLLCGADSPLLGRRFVLLVRDPRDALVSEYFSFGRRSGSHIRPKVNAEAFEARLNVIEDQGIDSYVLRLASNLHLKLDAYRQHMNFDLGLVRRYEDVYFDKLGFLREVFAHYRIEVDEAILERVAAKYDVRPETEDESRHIRQGLPGDHARKLKPETVERLNDIFRDIGAFYGYSL